MELSKNSIDKTNKIKIPFEAETAEYERIEYQMSSLASLINKNLDELDNEINSIKYFLILKKIKNTIQQPYSENIFGGIKILVFLIERVSLIKTIAPKLCQKELPIFSFVLKKWKKKKLTPGNL